MADVVGMLVGLVVGYGVGAMVGIVVALEVECWTVFVLMCSWLVVPLLPPLLLIDPVYCDKAKNC